MSSSKSDVRRLYEPVYVLSKLILIAPDSLTLSSPKERRFLYGAVYLCLYGLFVKCLTFALTDVKTQLYYARTSITYYYDMWLTIQDGVLLFVVLTTAYRHRNEMLKILKTLEGFDEACHEYSGYKKMEFVKIQRRPRNYVVLHVILSALFIGAETFCVAALNNRTQWYTLTSLAVTLYEEVTILQFVTVLGAVYFRFKHVNSTLSEFERGRLHEIDALLDGLRLQKILHDSLGDVCRELTRIYGAYHVTSLLLATFEQVGHVFYVYILIRSNDEKSSLFYVWFVRNLLHATVKLVSYYCFVITYSDLVHKESARTSHVIQRWFLRSRHQDLIAEDIQLFTLQVQQCKVSLTACGLFVLDRQFALMLLGNIASYVIYFVQNQISIDKRSEP